MSKYSLGNFTKVPQALKDSIRSSRADFRQLGKSGLRISNPILGGMHIGNSSWVPWVLEEDQVSRYIFRLASQILVLTTLSAMRDVKHLFTRDYNSSRPPMTEG